jgi:hypothetical protein
VNVFEEYITINIFGRICLLSPVSSYFENCKDAALKEGRLTKTTLENLLVASPGSQLLMVYLDYESWCFVLPYSANQRG